MVTDLTLAADLRGRLGTSYVKRINNIHHTTTPRGNAGAVVDSSDKTNGRTRCFSIFGAQSVLSSPRGCLLPPCIPR